jgi:hypothetical protein
MPEKVLVPDVLVVDNVRIEINGSNLRIDARLPSPDVAPMSKSRKSKVYATTGGNVAVGAFKVGLNCYRAVPGFTE